MFVDLNSKQNYYRIQPKRWYFKLLNFQLFYYFYISRLMLEADQSLAGEAGQPLADIILLVPNL